MVTKKKKKKLWAITYSDGYEFSGVLYEIYDDKKLAETREVELNAAKQCQCPGSAAYYEVNEFVLNTKSKYLP